MQSQIAIPGVSPEEYFRAIEQSFRDTLEQQSAFWWPGQLASLIFRAGPLGPILLVIPFLFGLVIGRVLIWLIHPQNTQPKWLGSTLSSPPFWGFVAVVVFMAVSMFLVVVHEDSKRTTSANWLSPAQMRFCYCYGFAAEVAHYQSDRLPKHLDNAFHLWKLLLNLLKAEFNGERVLFPLPSVSDVLIDAKAPPPLLPALVNRLRQSFSWFRLEPETAKIVDALEEFPSKLNLRIRDGKDLPILSEVMRCLGDYMYSRLPEIAPESEQAQRGLAAWGETRLVNFSEKLVALPQYSWASEPAKQPAWVKRAGRWIYGQTAVFSHDNVLICFMAWLIASGAIVAIAIKALLHWLPTIKFDSTLASVAISAPLITAATLVALSRKRRA